MLLKKGIRRCWLHGPQPLVAGRGRLVGPAFTLRFIPVREDQALVWPPTQHGDAFVPARGEHTFAPLALVTGASVHDLRHKINQLTKP